MADSACELDPPDLVGKIASLLKLSEENLKMCMTYR